jgi:hypothetical protein
LACHYHDRALAGTERDNETAETREQLRRDHAIRIEKELRANWSVGGFQDEDEASLLGLICRGHRPERDEKGHSRWESFPEARQAAPGHAVRVRLVSAILFAADELHIGRDRAPQRIQMESGLQNPDSLKHWERHRRVGGPSVVRESLQFDVRVETIALERDLRSSHLAKAFQAVADLNRELQSAGMTTQARGVVLQWNREDLWQVLLLETCADMKPRSRCELIQEVVDVSAAETDTMAQLTELCQELQNTAADRRREIEGVIDRFIRSGYLTSVENSADRLTLETNETVNNIFVELLKQADKIDHLFKGPFTAQHEFALFRNEYGRQYIQKYLRSKIEATFSIFLPKEPGVPRLWDLLSVSPTAAQIAVDFPPLPTSLEKRDLLAITILAGALQDCLRDPTALLEVETRNALRNVADYVRSVLPGYITFLEELAIVLGLSNDEIRERMHVSEAEIAEGQAGMSEDKKFELSLTQSVSKDALAAGGALWLSHLAGQRAGVKISILNTEDSPLAMKIKSGRPPIPPDHQPCMVSFGPSDAKTPITVHFPCDFSFDADTSTLHIKTYRLDDPAGERCAFVAVTRLDPAARESSADFDIRPPRVTVGHIETWREADAAFMNHGGLIVYTQLDNDHSTSREQPVGSRLGDVSPWIPIEEYKIITELGRDVSIPLAPHIRTFRQLIGLPSESRQYYWSRLQAEIPPTVTSFSLWRCNIDGRAVREVFLDAIIGTMNCPLVAAPPGEEAVIDNFRARWCDTTVTSTLAWPLKEDPAEVESLFIEWAKDTSKPFPLNFQGERLTVVRGHITLERRPSVNRLWYVEIPILFRVRPTTKREQLSCEYEFWKSKGDERRAALISERIVEAARKEEVTVKQSQATKTV